MNKIKFYIALYKTVNIYKNHKLCLVSLANKANQIIHLLKYNKYNIY